MKLILVLVSTAALACTWQQQGDCPAYSSYSSTASVVTGSSPSISVRKDVIYNTNTTTCGSTPNICTYDVAYPTSGTAATEPIYLCIHAGGLIQYQKDLCWSVVNDINGMIFMAEVCNCAVYSVNYRLTSKVDEGTGCGVSPCAFWPAQDQDVKCFVFYLVTNAGVATIPGNVQDIRPFGISSGGHLAADIAWSAFNSNSNTGCSNTASSSFKITRLVLLYSLLNLAQQSPDIFTTATDPNSVHYVRDPMNCAACVDATLHTDDLASSVSALNFYTGTAANKIGTYVEAGGNDVTAPNSTSGALMTSIAATWTPAYTQIVNNRSGQPHGGDCTAGASNPPGNSQCFQDTLRWLMNTSNTLSATGGGSGAAGGTGF